MRTKLVVMLVTLGLLLTGCNMPQATTSIPPTNTSAPRSTATQPPALATPTTLPLATATNVPAATPTISNLPTEPVKIVIQAPGKNSKITSPITLSGESDPTFEQGLGIQITGEDGAIVAEGHAIISAEIGTRGPFDASLTFSVAHDQPGRLAVFDVSARDGGLLFLTSIPVTLLAGGSGAEILPAEAPQNFFRIDQPTAFGEVSGGVVHVEGLSGPAFENTILVALCGEGGTSGDIEPICGMQDNTLFKTPVQILAPDAGQPGTFSVDLPYSVSQDTFARVAVYTLSPMDGGVIELNSIELILKP